MHSLYWLFPFQELQDEKKQFSLYGNVNHANLKWNTIASGTRWETSGEIHRELHYSNLRAKAQFEVILSSISILPLTISDNP